MAWYRPTNPPDDRLWVYSERGLMSYAFVVLFRDNPGVLLDNATNGFGHTLRHAIGDVRTCCGLAEFSLGTYGFGSPDGGLFLKDSSGLCSFVFVEAKRDPWVISSLQAPMTTQDELATIGEVQLQYLCEQNHFNSSINGQLELRWRFANAFQIANQVNNPQVMEGPGLPAELMQSDRLYWRSRLQPTPGQIKHWRRVSLGGTHNVLRSELARVQDRFYFLAITADEQRPPLELVRAYSVNHEMLSEDEKKRRLFWLPFSHLPNLMEEVRV